jgi:hypothetical protein
MRLHEGIGQAADGAARHDASTFQNMGMADCARFEKLADIFRNRIAPLLEEDFFWGGAQVSAGIG